MTTDAKPSEEQARPNGEDTQAPDNNTRMGSSITLGSTITIDSDSDRTNNNSLDTSSKSAASVEVIAQTLHGARQGSHFTPAAYKSICQQKAAENLARYTEQLREGQFDDLEMNPPDMPALKQDRSVAQSPLSRQQQLPSTSCSEHSSMPLLTKTSASELSDITDDEPDLVIKGHASSETYAAEEDEIVLHEDPVERLELKADLPKESGNIVDEIDIQLKQYFTTPKGRGNNNQHTTTRNRFLVLNRSRRGEGQGWEGQGMRPEDPNLDFKKMLTGFNCVANIDMEWKNQCDLNDLFFTHFYLNVNWTAKYSLKYDRVDPAPLGCVDRTYQSPNPSPRCHDLTKSGTERESRDTSLLLKPPPPPPMSRSPLLTHQLQLRRLLLQPHSHRLAHR